jgi:ABC-type bacteriocin/lantibiotic exporter with double-glycine peptidase domain
MAGIDPGITPLKRFFRLLQVDRKDIGYIYIYAIFSGLITLTLPLGIQAIIGLIVGGTISTAWMILIAVVTLGTALTGWLKVMQLYVTETIQRRIFTRSSFDFAFRIPRLPLEKLVGEHPPELVNRFFDTLTLQKGLPKILMDFSSSILQIIFGLVLISFYHPLFVFFGIFLIVIVLIIFYFTGPAGLQTSLKESRYKYEVAYWLEEIARTLATFKLSGHSELPLEKTDKLVSNYLDYRKKHFRILVTQYASVVGFKTVITAGLLILGSILVVDNQINIGQFVAAEIVIILTLNSVEKLILTMETVYDVLTALEKIGHVMDIPFEQAEGLCFEDIDTGKGLSIETRDLSYRFSDAEQPTLDRINLRVQSGEKVCIAGYNSAGKSTLIQLLSGLFQNYTGTVTFNGIPMRNLNLVSLRAYTGDFTAHEDIFQGTLLENISLGNKAVKIDDVVKAMDDIGLGDFIKKLPEGFHTPLLPGGRNLPRSIVTKIILARSIVTKPALLTMQEIFTNLEQRDRVQIANLLTRKDQKWTLLAVSDDPILAARCDRIIILKDGKIIQEGDFAEILESPHYSNVFKTASKAEPSYDPNTKATT